MTTTGDQVLAFLAAYDLQQTGTQTWRCNSPLRANSNSHSFTMDLDPDGEHGTWYDHVDDSGGSLYALRDLLKLPKQAAAPTIPSTKRLYRDLADYAQAHHVAEQVFLDAGWQNAFWFAQPALSFTTLHGPRYRLIDGSKDSYIQAGGYKACLYRLPDALALSQYPPQPLVICNGEASTVVAQAAGVAAFCQNMGEKKLTPDNIKQLAALYPPHGLTGGDVEILIAFDSDDKGRKAAPKVLEQLTDAGYVARAIDLLGADGFDLADFCGLHGAGSITALAALPDLSGTQHKPAQANAAPAGTTPGAISPVSQFLIDANHTDAGNAECLVALYGSFLRYDHTRGKSHWLAWDGQRWRLDTNGSAQRFALLTVRARYHAAAQIPDLERRKALASWAIRSESQARILAMLAAASVTADLATTISQYDTDPMLTSTTTGTLDLRTGSLRQAAQRDYLTMQLGTRYDAAATCPRWLQFLQEIFAGDTDLIAYIQRAVGYSLTGDTREQKLFLCWGRGHNGKSVFLGTLKTLLGDYAAAASFHTFDAGNQSDATNDLAALRGSRLVTMIETDEDRRLAEAKVKQVTGGDMIRCRFLYGEFFEYKPAYKIWLAMNHKPTIRGTDRGIWRRIAFIPFTQNFEQQNDQQLEDKLKKGELPGILNWALAGLAAWHASGLGTCPAVEQATDDYRRESDELARWLLESVIVDPNGTLESSDAYADYQLWAKNRGERHPMTQTAWGRRLGELQFKSKRQVKDSRFITVYLGLRMRTQYDP